MLSMWASTSADCQFMLATVTLPQTGGLCHLGCGGWRKVFPLSGHMRSAPARRRAEDRRERRGDAQTWFSPSFEWCCPPTRGATGCEVHTQRPEENERCCKRGDQPLNQQTVGLNSTRKYNFENKSHANAATFHITKPRIGSEKAAARMKAGPLSTAASAADAREQARAKQRIRPPSASSHLFDAGRVPARGMWSLSTASARIPSTVSLAAPGLQVEAATDQVALHAQFVGQPHTPCPANLLQHHMQHQR